ncbi:hypothetical protein [Pseudofrankia sp. DC12]|uniref:hypothetical protein n=1 Tax=Pseudofrankia sp. DC12 TaxID=683315 RepID=UPI000B1368F8|nr:hypothetical protein [Pseudofrankia sp. DC12]
MRTEAGLRGYLLEECLAWLLRASGYDLLTAADDTEVLDVRSSDLIIRGRGAWHQADVLGEFLYTPPFSLPVRLFVEAKFLKARVDLATVRNGHGVVHDVNENLVVTSPRRKTGGPVAKGTGARRIRARYRYSYAVFSTSGFTADALNYALAHQISLVDLSVPAFEPLRAAIYRAAQEIRLVARTLPAGEVPALRRVRTYLREILGIPGHRSDGPDLPQWCSAALDRLAIRLQGGDAPGVIVAFPAAPFVLGLVARSRQAFFDYCRDHPTHRVDLMRERPASAAQTTGKYPVWRLRSHQDTDAYAVTFGLPPQIEDWILEGDEIRRRASWVEANLLSSMTVYWMDDRLGHAHTFQLTYDPREITRY